MAILEASSPAYKNLLDQDPWQEESSVTKKDFLRNWVLLDASGVAFDYAFSEWPNWIYHLFLPLDCLLNLLSTNETVFRYNVLTIELNMQIRAFPSEVLVLNIDSCFGIELEHVSWYF